MLKNVEVDLFNFIHTYKRTSTIYIKIVEVLILKPFIYLFLNTIDKLNN